MSKSITNIKLIVDDTEIDKFPLSMLPANANPQVICFDRVSGKIGIIVKENHGRYGIVFSDNSVTAEDHLYRSQIELIKDNPNYVFMYVPYSVFPRSSPSRRLLSLASGFFMARKHARKSNQQ